MFGLKMGYVDFYMKQSLNAYRSISYYEEIVEIKAVYRKDDKMKMSDRCASIDSLNKLGLKQVLITCMDRYIATT
jgi:hypothetical protein